MLVKMKGKKDSFPWMSPVSKSPQTGNIAEGRKYGQFSKFACELYCGFVTKVTLSWIRADFEEKVC